MSDKVNYRYSDLAVKGQNLLRNADFALQAIRTLIFTQAGERIFKPDFGSELETFLWKTMDDFQALQIKNHLVGEILTIMDLVKLENLVVTPDYTNNSYKVYLKIRVDGVLAEDTITLKNKAV